MKFILCNKGKITLCALAVFALMLFPWQFAGISFRTWLVYLYTLGVGVFWIYDGKKRLQDSDGKPEKKKWDLRKWNPLDSLLAACLIGNVFLLIRDSLRGAALDENTLLIIVLVMLFFLLSGEKPALQDVAPEPVIYRYRDVFLGCGFVVCLELLWHFLLNKAFVAPVALLLENEQALLHFLLLMVMLAAEGYYKEADKGKKYFYILTALTGYFLLFVQKNSIGILLGGIGFLVSALVHKPEREQIKRISLLAFAYFFLLSNMSLLQQFIPALRENGGYDIKGSISLELGLALCCVVCLAWWGRQPEEERYLLQYKRWILKIAIAVCMILLSLLVSGGRLAGMEGRGAAILYALFVRLEAYVTAHDNTFAAVLGKYGVFGIGWLFAFLFLISKRVWEILYGECTLPIQVKRRKTEKSEEEKGLKRKMKIRGILFCLIAFGICFFVTDMEALSAGPADASQEGSAAGVSEEGTAQEEPVTGVPIESATLMYAVEKVNVRKGPGTDTEVLGELAQGERVFAVELLAEGWYRIVFGGETGYVRQDFLALYGTAGAWEAPEQPAVPAVAGQDSVATGKRAAREENATDNSGEKEALPRAAKQAAKSKSKNTSTVVIIAVVVLLILGYSVFQVVKEKRESEKGNDGSDMCEEEPEDGALDTEERIGGWAGEEAAETAYASAEEPAERENGEETAEAGYEEEAGEAEALEEDEMVILDIGEM